MTFLQTLRTPVLPQAPALPRALDTALAGALGALGFVLPFSVAGVSLVLAALLLLALAAAPSVWRSAPWRDPVAAAGLLLLAYIAAHTLLTSGFTPLTLRTVNRYHELLMLPILLALFRLVSREDAFFYGLAVGAVGYAAAHWVAIFNPALAAYLAPRRISAGFGLALCAFILLEQSWHLAKPWAGRLAAAFLAVSVLFAIEGRTGHVVVLLLVACAAWSHSPRRWRWGAMIALPLVVLAIGLGSPAVQKRVGETMAGEKPRQGSQLDSTGIRVELLRNGLDLAGTHYAAGVGYAHYAAVHDRATQARYAGDPQRAHFLQSDWVRTSNPHNEYLMQLVGGGIAALALFLAWLVLPLVRKTPADNTRSLLVGVSLAFAAGCLFNSLLMDFVEGHLYGVLLAWLLAQSRASARPDCMKRILVVATRQIGDVLLTTPLIRAARLRWPQARIEVLGFAGTLGMLRGNPDVDGLIESPARTTAGGLWSLARRLWRRYDLALVTQPGDRAHLLGWIAARSRSGIVPPGGSSNWWKQLLLDHAVPSGGDRGKLHVVAEKLLLLQPWLDPQLPAPGVVVPAPAALPFEIEAQLQPGAVAVHVPSMWTYKQWPLTHFRQVIEGLLAQGRQVVLTGGPGDRECIAPLLHLAPPPRLLDAAGRLDFNQLAGLLGRCALYIGPDTSVSHLAAAAGIPVIAIFGPTNPLRWSPWPAPGAGNVTVLQAQGLSCVPCSLAGCEDHTGSRSDCLLAITPEAVLARATAMLDPGR